MVLTPFENSHNQFMEFDPTSQRPSADQLEPVMAGENRGPRFRIFGFPLHIDPWFFLTAWLIGGRQEPLWMIVWVLVVLVGVLAHELGHAFVGRRLGLDPWIRLFAFGGMTAWRLSRPLGFDRRRVVDADARGVPDGFQRPNPQDRAGRHRVDLCQIESRPR